MATCATEATAKSDVPVPSLKGDIRRVGLLSAVLTQLPLKPKALLSLRSVSPAWESAVAHEEEWHHATPFVLEDGSNVVFHRPRRWIDTTSSATPAANLSLRGLALQSKGCDRLRSLLELPDPASGEPYTLRKLELQLEGWGHVHATPLLHSMKQELEWDEGWVTDSEGGDRRRKPAALPVPGEPVAQDLYSVSDEEEDYGYFAPTKAEVNAKAYAPHEATRWPDFRPPRFLWGIPSLQGLLKAQRDHLVHLSLDVNNAAAFMDITDLTACGPFSALQTLDVQGLRHHRHRKARNVEDFSLLDVSMFPAATVVRLERCPYPKMNSAPLVLLMTGAWESLQSLTLRRDIRITTLAAREGAAENPITLLDNAMPALTTLDVEVIVPEMAQRLSSLRKLRFGRLRDSAAVPLESLGNDGVVWKLPLLEEVVAGSLSGMFLTIEIQGSSMRRVEFTVTDDIERFDLVHDSAEPIVVDDVAASIHGGAHDGDSITRLDPVSLVLTAGQKQATSVQVLRCMNQKFGFDKLRELNIRATNSCGVCWSTLCEKASQLTRYAQSYGSFEAEAVKHLKKLQSISLRGCSIDGSGTLGRHLGVLPNLTSVDLESAEMAPDCLSGLEDAKSLTYLNIGGTKVDDVRHLEVLGPQLRIIASANMKELSRFEASKQVVQFGLKEYGSVDAASGALDLIQDIDDRFPSLEAAMLHMALAVYPTEDNNGVYRLLSRDKEVASRWDTGYHTSCQYLMRRKDGLVGHK